MLTVVCTNVGTTYGVEYVVKLQAMVARHLSIPHRFCCLTDDPGRYADYPQITALKEQTGNQGWWCKIGIYHRANGFTGRVLYLDLDVIPVQDLAPMLPPDGYWVIRDWLEPEVFNSSLILFTAEEYYYLADQHTWRDKGTSKTDQHYMAKHVKNPNFWNPQEVVSYKFDHCEEGPPPEARIVIFHGYPKPHHFSQGWVKEAWG